ncbi:hypothetical protein NKH77_43635 [Streptomyces sp. M19]
MTCARPRAGHPYAPRSMTVQHTHRPRRPPPGPPRSRSRAVTAAPGTGAARHERQHQPDQRGVQYRYHRDLFPALHDWEATERSIVEFTGDDGPAGLLGLDQMGHFGPQGCDVVADAVIAALGGTGGTVDLCELGSGFGGALRYTVDKLTGGGVAVGRSYGVDLVAEHCEVSAGSAARRAARR